MSDLAVRVRNLEKWYRVDDLGPHVTLKDALGERLRRIWRRSPRIQTDRLCVLHDVSFDIRRGTVTAVVGANGAGKSTLLRILARITPPTAGRVEIYGRVGVVLDIGTGFQPELSGRENLYLNGTLLGLRRAEIARHFDAIVDFAGIHGFVDTPVKRYSTGMWVRLAFSIAAHLRAEILFIDEGLAVGDAAFQAKCLARLALLAREGRTVVLVSHDMSAVQQLASEVVWLDHGKVNRVGPAADVIREYLRGAGVPVQESAA